MPPFLGWAITTLDLPLLPVIPLSMHALNFSMAGSLSLSFIPPGPNHGHEECYHWSQSCQDMNSGSASNWLCDPGHVTDPL